MIYFLAESLEAKDGASRSAADCLVDLLDLHRPLVVVSRTRFPLPPPSDGGPLPPVRWVPATWGPAPSPAGLGLSPRRWLSWGRESLRHGWKLFKAAVTTRLFPPTLAIHNEFPYEGSLPHRILHKAAERMILVHSSRDCIAHYLRRRKTLTTTTVADELGQMSGLVFVSPQLRDDWAEISNITSVRQWVLSNTCRENEGAEVHSLSREQLRATLGLPVDAFITVTVGYVHDGKGQDILVEVLPGLVAKVPHALAVFVGNDKSEWATSLKARIGGMGLADHVRFAGLRSDPYAFIRAADLLVHPSRTEGQGLVLLEAMMLGTPVLASEVGGVPSVITHGETGWLVPSNDPDALLKGLLTLVEDSDLRAALAERAEAAYWRHFNRTLHRERFLEIVASMTAQHPDRAARGETR